MFNLGGDIQNDILLKFNNKSSICPCYCPWLTWNWYSEETSAMFFHGCWDPQCLLFSVCIATIACDQEALQLVCLKTQVNSSLRGGKHHFSICAWQVQLPGLGIYLPRGLACCAQRELCIHKERSNRAGRFSNMCLHSVGSCFQFEIWISSILLGGHPAFRMQRDCWYYACPCLWALAALHIFLLLWDNLVIYSPTPNRLVLTKKPRLTLNSKGSFLSLLSVGNRDVPPCSAFSI